MIDINQSVQIVVDKTIFQKKVEIQTASTLRLIKKISKILNLNCETEMESDGTIIATLSYLQGETDEKQCIKNRTRINVALNIIETKQRCMLHF
ncbi:MAG: hypothetical protein ACXAD7_18395 [Candidatus Kariarchaeaceae archaeon]|jgi:hypothetical protein